MSDLGQQLQRIDNWLETNQSEYGRECRTSLTRGLTRQQIDDAIKDLPFNLPEEIYELYQWQDGGLELGYFSEVVYFCNLAASLGQIDNGTYQLICYPYFPFILADEYGAHVVKGEDFNQDCSPVYYYSKDRNVAEMTKIVSPNIANIFKAIAECLETYGFISASQASFNDDNFSLSSHSDPKTAMKILNELDAKYRPLFSKIYRKYRIEDIWY